MQRLKTVLTFLGRFLLGAAIFVFLAWAWLIFIEDNNGQAPTTAWGMAFEHWWFVGSLILSIPFGYPTYCLIHNFFYNPRLETLTEIIRAYGKASKNLRREP